MKDVENYMSLPYRVEGVSMNQYCVYLLSRGVFIAARKYGGQTVGRPRSIIDGVCMSL